MDSHLSNRYARGNLRSKRSQSSYVGEKIRVKKQKKNNNQNNKKTLLFGIRPILLGNACYEGYAGLRKYFHC